MLSRIAVALTVVSTFGAGVLSVDGAWARGGMGHGVPGRQPFFAQSHRFGPSRVVRINRNIDHKHVSVTRRRPPQVTTATLRPGQRLTRKNLPQGHLGYLRPQYPPANGGERAPVNPPSVNTAALPPSGITGRLPGPVRPYRTGTPAIFVPPSRGDGNTGQPSPVPGTGIRPGGHPPVSIGLPPSPGNGPPRTGAGDGPPPKFPPPPPPSRTGGDGPPVTPYPPPRVGDPLPPRGPIFPGGGVVATSGPGALAPGGSGPASLQSATAPVGGQSGNPAGPSGGNPTAAGGNRTSFAPPPDGETRFVPNEVLTVSGTNVTLNALDDIGRRYRLTRLDTRTIRLTGHVLSRWRINGGQSVATVIRTLAAENLLAAAQPNYLYSLQYEPTPEAPAAGHGQYVVSKLHLDETHRLATGDNVVVAVIDSAIDTTHPDLSGVIAGRFDALSEPAIPDAHGTAMAGALAAYGNLVGVAPRVRLLAVRALSASAHGGGGVGTGHAIITGLDWAATKGARVINMSFAGPADPEMSAALARASELGIVLVAAAGNAGPKSAPLYPAAYQQVIAVTATDSNDHLLEEANRGAYIAVSAPGVNVLVAEPGGGYRVDSGTSIAAAHVSGIAALLIERNPRVSPQALRNVLTATARPLGPKSPETEQAFGAGLVDPLDAVTTLDTASPPQSSIAAGSTP